MMKRNKHPSVMLLPALKSIIAVGLVMAVASASSGTEPATAASGISPAANSLPKIEDAVDPKNDTEPARVNAIHFFGNTKVSTDTLMNRIGIRLGEVMTKDKMGMALDRIVEEYRHLGLNAEVRPRVSHPKQNFVDVNFLIDEQGKGGHD